jgi:ribonuclease HI
MLMSIIRMYTDGSCLDNSKCKQGLSFGGYGCHILYPMNEYEEFSGGIEGSKVTNNVGELMGYKRGLERCIEVGADDILHVYCDSTYVINIFTKYIDDWIKYNWKKKTGKEIENLELIQDIYKLIQDSNLVIIYKKVKAHAPEPSKKSPKWYDWHGNDRADIIARDCAQDMKSQANLSEKENSPKKAKSVNKRSIITDKLLGNTSLEKKIVTLADDTNNVIDNTKVIKSIRKTKKVRKVKK